MNQLIIAILIVTSLIQSNVKPTKIADNIYVKFPYTDVEYRQYQEHVKIFGFLTDSLEYKAAVSISDKTLNADSISKIQGIDANVFNFIETQQGYDFNVEDSTINGIQTIFFSYNNDFRGPNMVFVNRGYFIYHKNLLIMVECSYRKDLENLVQTQNSEFLNSIVIK